jgi:hypothetical protein
MLNKYKFITIMEGEFCKIIIYNMRNNSIFYFYETK